MEYVNQHVVITPKLDTHRMIRKSGSSRKLNSKTARGKCNSLQDYAFRQLIQSKANLDFLGTLPLFAMKHTPQRSSSVVSMDPYTTNIRVGSPPLISFFAILGYAMPIQKSLALRGTH